jgi:hypothetical protein
MKTGETEQVNITVNSSAGTDENSDRQLLHQQAEEKFWEKVKNFFFGKKKKGEGVMLDENGMGDYRPGRTYAEYRSLEDDLSA